MSELLQAIEDKKRDAVLFKAEYLLKQAGADPDGQARAVEDIAGMIAVIKHPVKRNSYMEQISKKHKVKLKLLKDEIENIIRSRNNEKNIEMKEDVGWDFPKGVDVKEALRNGFYSYENNLNTGYYFPSGKSEWTQQSNFIIKPMMHVRSQADDKRMFEVINAFGRHVIDMPSRNMISLEQFKGTMFELPGNNLFFGTQQHLMKVLNVVGRDFEICYELKTLGWQAEGFFAYSNGIVTSDGFVPMDDRGIAEFNGTKYYSPSASSIYRNARKDDDEYANDRYLSYSKPPITFEEWCNRMVRVYEESNSGMIGIAFVMVSLFRDIVYSIDKNCPHLSAYGEKGSGKSKYAESLSNVFLNQLLPCNLFHSTDFAFANRISRYRNCLTWFDEFNDSTIREERFEAVKAAYEGVARERGKGGQKNKTEILQVNSTMILTGQYLSTKDDNAALTRCIIVPFRKRTEETARTQAEVKQYEELKQLEQRGLSGMLTELLPYRKELEKEYPKRFPEMFAELRAAINKMNGAYNERVMRNYCALVTCVDFFSEKIKLPFTREEFNSMATREIIKVSTLIAESDSLADFWNTVVYLMETGEIYEGFHFKIETLLEVNVKGGKKQFGQMKKVLFLRLTTIHKLYMEAHRRQSGKNGVNQSTILLYLSTGKGYIGHSDSGWFISKDGQKTNTSSEVFDYDLLNVPLERVGNTQEEKVLTEVTGKLVADCKLKDVAGVAKLHYRIAVDQSYDLMGKRVEKIVMVQCYDADTGRDMMLITGNEYVITGQLTVKKWKDKEGMEQETRVMEVAECRAKDQQQGFDFSQIGNNDMPF